MVDPVNNSSRHSIFQNAANLAKAKIFGTSSVKQTDLISAMEPTHLQKSLNTEELKQKTNEQAKIFIQRSTLYAKVQFLHKWCNYAYGSVDEAIDDITADRRIEVNQATLDKHLSKIPIESVEGINSKFLLIVKDLTTEQTSPGFFKIRSVMKKHFHYLSLFKMLFFYLTFLSWVPNLYIRNTISKILLTSREVLKYGQNLPELGSRVLKTANSYLANYNHAINRYRDDDTSPIGDKDDYLRDALKHSKIIGYDDIKSLYSDFAKAASKEQIRPDFNYLSNTIIKIRDLESIKIFKNIPKPILILPQLIVILATTLPLIMARFLEVFPNLIISHYHSKKIASFVPSVLKDTLEAVNQSGFTHAINCFLCDIISEVLDEMKKDPSDRNTKEPPKIVDNSLSLYIKKFSNLLFTLITREQAESREDLKNIQKNGLKPKSKLETLIKWIFSPQYVDSAGIKYVFVDKGLHPNIIELFNFLFGQPEKFEEYLCNLIELLNKIYDEAPDITTPEGLALLEEQREKQKRREALVNTLIEDGMTGATDDGINEFFKCLSKNQKKEIIFSYRKIKSKVFERIPRIQQDANSILLSCKDLLEALSPLNSQTQAKKDILLAKEHLKDLFTVIQNAIPRENGPVKKDMERHLKKLKESEQIVSDNICQIDIIHDQIEQLKRISVELKTLKEELLLKDVNYDNIKRHLYNLKMLKQGTEFDSIIDEYDFLSDQFNKIQSHKTFITTLTQVLNNSFFKDGLLLKFAKAQKEYLNNPKSINKAKRLESLHEKILAFLSQLELIADKTDIHQMKEVVRKISICPKSDQISGVYNKAKKLFEQKLLKHQSLLEAESAIVPTRYFSKCRSIIEKHEHAFSNLLKEKHDSIIKYAQCFFDSIQNLKILSKDIDKKKYSPFNGITTIQVISSVASFASAYFFQSKLLLVFGTIAGYTIYSKPLRSLTNSISIPIAKAAVTSADNIIKNSAFYEGLIHAYMKDFIDYVQNQKK